MESPPVWVEIDLKAIANNVRELRRIISPSARLMAVVKANAYGHGIIEAAGCALNNGADALGVARICEGIKLREAGFDVPVLIFNFTSVSDLKKLTGYDLTQTVYSCETAKAVSNAAVCAGKKIRIHIKVDTGMGRLGLLPECINDIESIACLPGLELEGVFTHFAAADIRDKSYTKRQFEIFIDILNRLQKDGIEIPVKHAANSAAIIDMPETHLDMVRSGILIYGLYPSSEVNQRSVDVKPAMELKSRVIHLKKVPAGFKISYGAAYETKKPTTIATIPAGYGDGVNRLLSSRGHMLVRKQKAQIVGRVCMDLTMLDVGDISDVCIDDEVVIFGSQGKEFIGADDIASSLNTINYEVLTSIPNSVFRYYLK